VLLDRKTGGLRTGSVDCALREVALNDSNMAMARDKVVLLSMGLEISSLRVSGLTSDFIEST
jgi:hypothetical protein